MLGAVSITSGDISVTEYIVKEFENTSLMWVM